MSLSQEIFDVTIENSLKKNLIPLDSPKRLALKDHFDSLLKWRIWTMLAYQDIKLRYRRSVLGPFWITLSMAITIYSMGYLYSKLFKIDLSNYYPFLASGILTWALISTIITELTDGLIASEGLIKQIKLPYTLYIHRIVYRNILIFFHNILVMIPILIFFSKTTKINLFTLLLFPGLFIIYINSLAFGLIISLLGTRYRDISQLVKSLLQVIFFITPIMWSPEILGDKSTLIIILNPIYPFIELIRKPLLGAHISLHSLIIAIFITLLNVLLSIKLFIKYRSRIIYWL